MTLKNIFVHHVFFWLKNTGNMADLTELVKGLNKLSSVRTIKQFHIGRPAETYRDVVERSYSVSWLLIFENESDQASYQTDPIHLQFIKECSHLWSKVHVHDSVDI